MHLSTRRLSAAVSRCLDACSFIIGCPSRCTYIHILGHLSHEQSSISLSAVRAATVLKALSGKIPAVVVAISVKIKEIKSIYGTGMLLGVSMRGFVPTVHVYGFEMNSESELRADLFASVSIVVLLFPNL